MSAVVEFEHKTWIEASKREKTEQLEPLARLIRYYILAATTQAGSGHPTSSLSATDLMTGLLFGGTFHYAVTDHLHPNDAGYKAMADSIDLSMFK